LRHLSYLGMKAVNVRVIGEKENESKNRDRSQNANIVEIWKPLCFFLGNLITQIMIFKHVKLLHIICNISIVSR